MGELRETDNTGAPVSHLLNNLRGAPARPVLTIDTGWERWYAWRPVKLYMSSRYAWLRQIYRRCLHKNGIETCDYTDMPEKFPANS
jgi:hypothetical protein